MDQNVQSSEDQFYMAGTEGTGEYKVLASSSFGRVGYRDLDDRVRIRLEPASEAHADKIGEVLTSMYGWKQPGDGGQNRFSLGLPKGDFALASLETAFGLIKRGRPLVYNPDMPNYQQDLLGK